MAFVPIGKRPIVFLDTETTGLEYDKHEIIEIAGVSMRNARAFFGWSSEGAHTAMKDAEDARRLYHTLLRAGAADRLLWSTRAMLRETFSQK